MFNYKIIKKIKDINAWGQHAVEFEGQYVYTDKKGVQTISEVFNLTLSEATYKLVEYFQTNPCTPELARLIEDYGQEKYSEAYDAAAEEAAGEDI